MLKIRLGQVRFDLMAYQPLMVIIMSNLVFKYITYDF